MLWGMTFTNDVHKKLGFLDKFFILYYFFINSNGT